MDETNNGIPVLKTGICDRQVVASKLLEFAKKAWDLGYDCGKLTSELFIAGNLGLGKGVIRDVNLEDEFEASKAKYEEDVRRLISEIFDGGHVKDNG